MLATGSYVFLSVKIQCILETLNLVASVNLPVYIPFVVRFSTERKLIYSVTKCIFNLFSKNEFLTKDFIVVRLT